MDEKRRAGPLVEGSAPRRCGNGREEATGPRDIMKGIDRSGREAAKVCRGSALAEAITLAFSEASDQEIRGFLGKILRAAGLPYSRAARVVGVSPAQHYRDLGACTIPLPGLGLDLDHDPASTG